MPTILTFTANILAETTYTFNSWEEGKTQRATEEFFQVGGKGINVTKMLSRLNSQTKAIYFPGGQIGRRCDAWLKERNFPIKAFPTEGETRSGAVVRAPGREETTYLGMDSDVSLQSVQACVAYLDTRSTDTVLAICGVIQNWDSHIWEPFRDLCKDCLSKYPFAVDCYGPALSWLVEYPLSLVKINRVEFAGLMNHQGIPDDGQMAALLEEAKKKWPVKQWVVTDGPNKVWSISENLEIDSAMPPVTNEVSPVGSGDVFFAGLLYSLFDIKSNLKQAVQFSLPLAAANASSGGIADFDLTSILEP
jgi:1-phosphofructokinase